MQHIPAMANCLFAAVPVINGIEDEEIFPSEKRMASTKSIISEATQQTPKKGKKSKYQRQNGYITPKFLNEGENTMGN